MRKPIIGVIPAMDWRAGYYRISKANCRAIRLAGGIPIVLPFDAGGQFVLQMIDGLYLTGGDDIDPAYFQREPADGLGSLEPERDLYELQMITGTLALQKPILAICRGAQMVNVALGGSMEQDITRSNICHQQKAPKAHPYHSVHIKENTLLHSIVGKRVMRVNSFHHQANKEAAASTHFSAYAPDGRPEAIESKTGSFLLGLQWHPEFLIDSSCREAAILSRKIYTSFINACQLE